MIPTFREVQGEIGDQLRAQGYLAAVLVDPDLCSLACIKTFVRMFQERRLRQGSSLLSSSAVMPSSEPRIHALCGTPRIARSSSGLTNCSQNWRCPVQNSPSL